MDVTLLFNVGKKEIYGKIRVKLAGVIRFLFCFFSTGPGCRGSWDNIACWERAEIGETVTIPYNWLRFSSSLAGNISRNCTADGWSDVFPNITSLIFYMVVQTLYTLGHSLSLIALTTGSAILCLFRKLHCTRNYIHLNLFFSFILRAVAVLIKDDILFSRNTQCSNQPSLMGCKASLVFFQYFIMANFFWLLVEGLYLHTLLIVIFSENRHFIVYLLIGWGIPTVFVFAWLLDYLVPHSHTCGYFEDFSPVAPITALCPPPLSQVNFILFISIIRILVQKLRCPDVGGNDQSQYRRLAKSTLLLIPLFGIHYVVFVSPSESIAENYKIFFDLAIGSFQVEYIYLIAEKIYKEIKVLFKNLTALHQLLICKECQKKKMYTLLSVVSQQISVLTRLFSPFLLFPFDRVWWWPFCIVS
uniref:Vasoactive intestinal peptide receptor 2 n=1 Tax=Myripristis murdjan TaxID=586833 RepID=A0A668AK64_9TELE